LAKVSADQRRAITFNYLGRLENAKPVKDFPEDPGDSRLSSSGIPGEDEVK